MAQLTNWAGNYTYGAARVHVPTSVEQVQEVVRQSHKLKVLGTRHSFNDIADSPGELVSLQHLDRVIALDRERRTVTIEGGVRYAQLGPFLHREGYALHNQASLPHISVVGACATATHGSGDTLGNLATAVSALELVTADGSRVLLSRDGHGDLFPGAVVSLGGLGVVVRLTLDLVPSFDLRQDVYENLPLAQLATRFDEIMSSAYSVSLFTNWRSEWINQVWLKRRVTEHEPQEVAPEWFGATRATRPLHPIAELPAEPCTPQLGQRGPWHERLPHFRAEHVPSSGAELQSEYLVPRHHAVAALRAIAELREQVAPLLQISEVRTVAADDLWLSPCYGQPCVAIHFTWKPLWPAVKKVLPLLEAQLAPLDARPHWGKLFATSPARLAALYERLPDFQQLLHSYDPQGKFRNAFLDTYLFGSAD